MSVDVTGVFIVVFGVITFVDESWEVVCGVLLVVNVGGCGDVVVVISSAADEIFVDASADVGNDNGNDSVDDSETTLVLFCSICDLVLNVWQN